LNFTDLSDIGGEEFKPKIIPEYLERRQGETLATWRDRVYHEYRVSCFLSALAEPRLSYIEQTNPLLTRCIIDVVRSIPDHLRTGKKLFKRIVKRLESEIPIASMKGIPTIGAMMEKKEIRDLFLDVINSEDTKGLFPPKFIRYLNDGLTNKVPSSYKKRYASVYKNISSIPPSIKKILGAAVRKLQKPKFNSDRLAIRGFIISRMHQILKEDALFLR
jgi:hypothetical protein